MFYSDDPARDWDNYCDYQDRKYDEWYEEHRCDIENRIEEYEDAIEDLKDKPTLDEYNEIAKEYDLDVCDNIDELEFYIEDAIHNLEYNIENIEDEFV